MVKYTLFSLFMALSLIGCNTEMADLGRISSQTPMVIQMGAVTKIPGFNNSGDDRCPEVAIDRFENIICAGTTTGSVGKITDGSQDGLVAKFDRTGKLLWTVQLQSNGGSDGCGSVGVDDDGNIYCGGTTDRLLGTGTVLNKYYVNPNFVWLPRPVVRVDTDAFVAKISPQGQVLWIKQFGSAGEEACSNLAVSPSGNAYCGSVTTDQIGTHAETGLDEGIGGTNLSPMVAKISSNGNILWIRQFGSLTQPAQYMAEDKCGGVALDEDENVYCGGYTRGNLNGETNGGQNPVTGIHSQDPFVWVLDKNGFTVDLFQFGINASTPYALSVNVNANEVCEDITVDKEKNVYCAITHSGLFGETANGTDFTVVKWNSSHQVEWIRQMGQNTMIPGYTNAGHQVIHALSIREDGTLLAVGSTTGSTAAPLSGPSDILMVNFDQNGNIIWGSQFGSSGSENCLGVTTDQSGNIYCSGNTNGAWGDTYGGGANDAVILRVSPLGKL